MPDVPAPLSLTVSAVAEWIRVTLNEWASGHDDGRSNIQVIARAVLALVEDRVRAAARLAGESVRDGSGDTEQDIVSRVLGRPA